MEDLKSFIPGRPDIKDILPVYRKVDAELRKIKPDYILFFENTPVPDTLPIFGGLFLGKMSEKPAGMISPRYIISTPIVVYQGEIHVQMGRQVSKNLLKYVRNFTKSNSKKKLTPLII